MLRLLAGNVGPVVTVTCPPLPSRLIGDVTNNDDNGNVHNPADPQPSHPTSDSTDTADSSAGNAGNHFGIV